MKIEEQERTYTITINDTERKELIKQLICVMGTSEKFVNMLKTMN